MTRQDIELLIQLVDRSTLSEVSLRTKGCALTIRKEGTSSNVSVCKPIDQTSVPPANTEAQTAQNSALPNELSISIKAPMVGTFYTASDPEGPPFVQVGDRIQKGQKVCIIEAMKVFNEIESDVSGTITKILVKNASPVEYDQPLFIVESASDL